MGDANLTPITIPKTNEDWEMAGEQMAYASWCWYNTAEVQYLLGQMMNRREIVLFADYLKGPVRPLWVFPHRDAKPIRYILDRFNFKEKAMQYRLYGTVFKLNWDMFPKQPQSIDGLKDYREEFTKVFPDARTEADFVLDIDGNHIALNEGRTTPEEEFQRTKEWALRVHDFMLSRKISHFINFSGGTGFNVRIPADFLPAWEEWYGKAPVMAEYIAYKNDIPFNENAGVDSSVYDSRRVFKVPYTLSKGKVVLPVTTRELNNFSFSDYDLITVVDKDIFHRNHFTTHGVIYDFGKKGVMKLLEDLK